MRSAQLTTSPSGEAGAGARPRVVADTIEGLVAQVERGQRHVRPPHRMVEPRRRKIPRASSLDVAPRPVPAVVPEGDRLGERHVEPTAPATAVATWATSSAWVRRVRWWSAGKTNTWVLPARRRKAVECRMRSRSRSKQVRRGSGSSARARGPRRGPGWRRGRAPGPRAPRVGVAPRCRGRRPGPRWPGSRDGRCAPRRRRGRPWCRPSAVPARCARKRARPWAQCGKRL